MGETRLPSGNPVEAPPAKQTAGQAIASILAGLGSVTGLAGAFFWMIGNAYSENVLYNYGISSRLLDKSIYASAEIGFRVFWATIELPFMVSISIATALFLLLFAIRKTSPMRKIADGARARSAAPGGARIPQWLGSPPGLVALTLVIGIPLLALVPKSVGRHAARLYIAEVQTALASCASNAPPCVRYTWSGGNVVGIQLTADGNSTFILTPDGVTRIPDEGTIQIQQFRPGSGGRPSNPPILAPPVLAAPTPAPIFPTGIEPIRLPIRPQPRSGPVRAPPVVAVRAPIEANSNEPVEPPELPQPPPP